VRRLTAGAALAASLCLLSSAGAAGAGVSLPAIERQVMCVTCKIPLDEAQSPQADRERAFIRSLISQGRSESQIKAALVSQYGPTALALPSAHGFDAAAYVVPAAVVLGLIALLALLLPSWRRRARAARPAPEQQRRLSAEEAQRLEADLARFD
jgi:cytochrome c-type biogenesis protein CcmH